MPKLPRLSGLEMLGFRERQGFTVERIRGSHHFLKKGLLHTTVPVHGNRTLKAGTLRGILRDVNMSPAEFAEQWK